MPKGRAKKPKKSFGNALPINFSVAIKNIRP
jgi:hypothetical protein